MMLKPTFPSPYMSSVDADEPVVISCVTNERNYIEGYDLCVKKTDGTMQMNVFGFWDFKNKRMNKYWKRTEKDKNVTLTSLGTNFSQGYSVDTAVGETQLPIDGENRQLVIKLPTESGSTTYNIGGQLVWQYSARNQWEWCLEIDEADKDVLVILKEDDYIYEKNSTTKKLMQVTYVDIVSYRIFVKFIDKNVFKITKKQPLSGSLYGSWCEIWSNGNDYTTMGIGNIYYSGTELYQETITGGTENTVYTLGEKNATEWGVIKFSLEKSNNKYYVKYNDTTIKAVVGMTRVQYRTMWDSATGEGRNYTDAYLLNYIDSSGNIQYRLYPCKTDDNWTKSGNNFPYIKTTDGRDVVYGWGYVSGGKVDNSTTKEHYFQLSSTDYNYKKYKYYPFNLDSSRYSYYDIVNNKSVLFNNEEYEWNIRLFGKGEVVGYGECSTDTNTTFNYQPNDNWVFIGDRLDSDGWTKTYDELLVSDVVHKGYRIKIKDNGTTIAIYPDSQGTATSSTGYNFIALRSTESDYMSISPWFYFNTEHDHSVKLGTADTFVYHVPYAKQISGAALGMNRMEFNWWNIQIYNSDGDIVDDSGKQYVPSISYTPKRPILSGDYSATLICEFPGNRKITSEAVEFTSSICETTSTTKFLSAKDTSRNRKTIEININQTSTYYDFPSSLTNNGYSFLRKDCETGEVSYLGFYIPKNFNNECICDYSCGIGREYEYIAYPAIYDESKNTYDVKSTSYKTKTSQSIRYNGWILYDLIPTNDDGVYKIGHDNIWYFNVGIKNGTFSPRYNKVVETSLGAYPKIYIGKNNYLEGSLSCNIGDVSCGASTDEYSKQDDIYRLKRWQKFCGNGRMKLLKSPKGHVIPCDIIDTSYEVNNGLLQETQISFQYVQLKDENEVNVYEVR